MHPPVDAVGVGETSANVAAGVIDAITVGVGEGVRVGVGVAVAVVVLTVAVGVGDGVVVLSVQPVVAVRMIAQINSNGSAYLNGILMYRFIILVIGFILITYLALTLEL